jgi:hypothetical protein
MQTLSAGLHSNSTITRLLFHQESEFPPRGTSFPGYLKSLVTQPRGLRQLCYSGRADLLVEAMVPQDGASLTQHMVGSAVQELWLCRLTGFLDSYSSNAAMIHLKCLTVRFLDRESMKDSCQCVPSLVHLRELNFESVSYQFHYSDLLESFKKNGSLYSISFPKTALTSMFGSPYVLDPRQRERMAAFCRRNHETTQIF